MEKISIIIKNKTIYLEQTLPEIDECKKLILEVLKQAVRDYQNFSTAISGKDKEIFEETKDFIFDDEYRFFWGDKEVSLKDILDILSIDIDYFREKIIKMDIKVL